MIHRCLVKLKLMLMFAETDDMRKQGPRIIGKVVLSNFTLPVSTLSVKLVLDLSDQPHRASGQTYSGAKSFSKSSFDSLAPSSDNHTDLFFVAGSEM